MSQLVQEARDKRYPDTAVLRNLARCVSEAEKCASLATQLVNRNMRRPLQTPNVTGGDKRTKLSIAEVELFLQQMASLPCVVKETALIEVSSYRCLRCYLSLSHFLLLPLLLAHHFHVPLLRTISMF